MFCCLLVVLLIATSFIYVCFHLISSSFITFHQLVFIHCLYQRRAHLLLSQTDAVIKYKT